MERDTMKISYNSDEKSILRNLAERWMKIAQSDEMKEKKHSWKLLKDLKPVRPMILFEGTLILDFISDKELHCENELLQLIEKYMLYYIKQHDLLNDDIILEKYFRIPWRVVRSDYGVPIVEQHAENSIGHVPSHPIQSPDDLYKLKERTFYVDREFTLALKNALEEIFGDILPVRAGNYDLLAGEWGMNCFTGSNYIGITLDMFKLIGNDNILLWPYDEPDAVHELSRFLCDDRRRLFEFLKKEKLMEFNADNEFIGSGSYGYLSSLPDADSKKDVDFKDVWVFAESQETATVSPQIFNEFFLPYIAEIANMFGLTYYGCCEQLHDRADHIIKAIPNLRAVSVSPWSNKVKMSEILGKKYVYSWKPNPAFLSGKIYDEKGAENEIKETFKAAKSCSLEIIIRDVYNIDGDITRLRRYVDMMKNIIGI